MLAPASGVLQAKNHDFVGGLVYGVVHEITVFGRDELAYAFCPLPTADARKQNEIFQTLIDGSANALAALGLCCRT
jgi:hypothetical protein